MSYLYGKTPKDSEKTVVFFLHGKASAKYDSKEATNLENALNTATHSYGNPEAESFSYISFIVNLLKHCANPVCKCLCCCFMITKRPFENIDPNNKEEKEKILNDSEDEEDDNKVTLS